MAYDDARLVALYDDDNPDGPDHDWYRSLADDRGAASIVDLGCGTGILTVTFVRPGRRVVGVDPSAEMLAVARSRAGGDAVTWVEGASDAIPMGPFDLAVMTGNTAQHIPDDAWHATLRDLRAAMRDGATLAFESRNPLARAWEGWTVPPTARDTAEGPLEESMAAELVRPGVVLLTETSRFVATGETVVATQELRFRSRDELVTDLEGAGFAVDAVLGSWHGRAVADDDALLIVDARAV